MARRKLSQSLGIGPCDEARLLRIHHDNLFIDDAVIIVFRTGEIQ